MQNRSLHSTRQAERLMDTMAFHLSISAFRLLLLGSILWALFDSSLLARVPRILTFDVSWLGVALYSAVALILVVRYFPRITNASRRRTAYYFFDLGQHAALLITLYALIYKLNGLVDGNTVVTDPWDCLYFSIVTWTTLGYGDIAPAHASRMFAASEALCGYIFMGLYLAIVLHVLTLYANSKARER